MAAHGIPDVATLDNTWSNEAMQAAYLLIQKRRADEGNQFYQAMLAATTYGFNAPRKAPQRLFGTGGGRGRSAGPQDHLPPVTASNAKAMGLRHRTDPNAKKKPTEEAPITLTPEDIAAAKEFRRSKQRRKQDRKRKRGSEGSAFARIQPPQKGG